MKKIIIALISCMVLSFIPTTLYAKKKIYVQSNTSSYPSGPRRGTVWEFFTIDVDHRYWPICFLWVLWMVIWHWWLL